MSAFESLSPYLTTGFVLLADGLEEMLLAAAYERVRLRDNNDDGQVESPEDSNILIAAGIFPRHSEANIPQNVFYSFWADNPLNDTATIPMRFEGISDADLERDVYLLEIQAALRGFEFLVQIVSPRELSARFDLPLNVVMSGGHVSRLLKIRLKVKQ